MLVQDFRRLSIVTKKVVDRCEDLANNSRHKQDVQWRNQPYVVDWGLNFDEQHFKIYVCCTGFGSEREMFVWPSVSGDPESDGDVLVTIIGNRLASLEMTDEWPSVLLTEWLKEQTT
jgi:hypothetical protein